MKHRLWWVKTSSNPQLYNLFKTRKVTPLKIVVLNIDGTVSRLTTRNKHKLVMGTFCSRALNKELNRRIKEKYGKTT